MLAKGSQINSFRVVALTVSKITDKKLRGEAEQMVDSFEGSRMRLEGEGDFVRAVGARSQGKYSLILVNYDPKNRNKELAPITLTHLENGTYSTSITTVGGVTVKNEGSIVVDGIMKRTIFMAPNQITLITLEREK